MPRSRLNREEYFGYAMIAPFYLFLTVFILIPIGVSALLSLTDYDIRSLNFVGLANYLKLGEDPFFLVSVRNTVFYTLFTLLVTMALGLLFAVLLNRRAAGVKVLRTLLFVPHVTSMVAVSMIWLWIYEPSHGILNHLIAQAGIAKQKWLYDARLALPSIIVMSVWKEVGYNMVVYLAGLQSIPGYLYEAATIDGAGDLRRFLHITWPMLRPITFFLFVTGLIANFNVFEQVQVLTAGGPMNATTTVVHQIYDRAFNNFQMGYASAMAVVMLVVVAAITLANLRFGDQRVDTIAG